MKGRRATLFFLVLFLASAAAAGGLFGAVGAAEDAGSDKAGAHGGEKTHAAEIAGAVRERYEKVTSLSARFVQENFLMTLGRTDVSRGRVYFKKPDKMRWDYTEPVRDAVVSDGTTMWVYDAELAQVIETPIQGDTAAIAMGFLAGSGDLTKDFSVTLIEAGEAGEAGEARPSAYLLSLTPRTPIETVTAITIEVDKKTYLIVKSVLEDRFGGRTTISLDDIKLNPALDDSLFRFVVPEGVRVLRP